MPKVIFDRLDKKRQRVPMDVLEVLEEKTASATRVASRVVEAGKKKRKRKVWPDLEAAARQHGGRSFLTDKALFYIFTSEGAADRFADEARAVIRSHDAGDLFSVEADHDDPYDDYDDDDSDYRVTIWDY